MDLVTHGLASFAVARGLFPRGGRAAVGAAVLAGCFANVDWLSNYFGAPAALAWRRTYLHSILAAVVISLAAAAIFLSMGKGRSAKGSQSVSAGDAFPSGSTIVKKSQSGFAILFAAGLVAALLHLAMDSCQSDGVMLFWPFSAKRFAFDWLPRIDPWILAILILAIAMPELLRLVSSEIGAKSEKPRGRTGALIGLALVVAYIGGRGILHSEAVSLLESRSFHGESARRALAFPEPLSLITWHGIVETESGLNQIDVNLSSVSTFDPDASLRMFKPEASPALAAAGETRATKEFLAVAQVPKASVEKTDVGSVVIVRDLGYAATGETQREIACLIELDPDNRVTSQEIVWARDLHN